jgi:hypothetical protein
LIYFPFSHHPLKVLDDDEAEDKSESQSEKCEPQIEKCESQIENKSEDDEKESECDDTVTYTTYITDNFH